MEKETIRILGKHSGSMHSIVKGPKTTDLLARFIKLSETEKEVLLEECVKILGKCIDPSLGVGSTTGIAIGYVQSGKTMSFTTLTALAVDNGFRFVIYFAGVKVNLLEQTTKRLKKDLLTETDNARSFKVYQSPKVEDGFHLRIKNNIDLEHKPAILITVLKHYKHIDALADIFRHPEVREKLIGNGVLIIDDEADQASLNGYARSNSKSEEWEEDEFTSTYSSILDLRAALPNHTYIQYTATPQGPLLINLMDLLAPKFHVVLTPGQAYTGGKTFFIDNPDLVITIPSNEVYHHKHNPLHECPESLVKALQLFSMGVAINVNIMKKEAFLSMMVHADREQDASKTFHNWITKLKDSWSDRLNLKDSDPSKMELLLEFRANYPEVIRRLETPPSFDYVMRETIQVLLDTNIELVIGKNTAGKQKKNVEIDWSNASAHILVGAEMLNRGYTIEGLAVSYMPRYSIGKSNADTIQQRCRFFGYKSRYIDFCRVFLPSDSIIEYVDYVEHEEIMRNDLKKQSLRKLEQVLVLSDQMNPTRNNILSKDLVKNKLCGWRQMNALQHVEENKDYVNLFLMANKLKNYTDFGTEDRNHRFAKLEISKIIEFLREFKVANMPDALRKSSTIQYLLYLADKKKVNFGYVFEMAYAVQGGRVRTLEKEKKNNLKINNIFSGRSSKGVVVYPGDKGVKFDDGICIQIHKVKLKHDSTEWANKVVYTLGLYYPEDLAHSFVGVSQ